MSKEVKTQSPFDTKDVTLKDGRVVTVRELTGADEMLAINICAKILSINEKEMAAALMQQQNVLVMLSILKIDDEPQSPPKSFEEVLSRLTKFKTKDLVLIKQAFNELNNPEDFLS